MVGQHNDAAAVRCVGLTRRFAALVAVDGLDLEVHRGEIFALVGPDGAGKTTLIRLLCGALVPDAGAAVVAGRDVVRDPEGVKARRRMCVSGRMQASESGIPSMLRLWSVRSKRKIEHGTNLRRFIPSLALHSSRSRP